MNRKPKKGGNAYLLNYQLLKSRDGIASKMSIVAEGEQRFSNFMMAQNEHNFLLLQRLFFVTLFDGLEHASLISVYGVASKNCRLEWVWILIRKYGLGFRVCLFFFLFFLFFFLWISGLIFFIRVSVLFFYFWVNRRTVRIFKRIILYVSVFEGDIFANVSIPS